MAQKPGIEQNGTTLLIGGESLRYRVRIKRVGGGRKARKRFEIPNKMRLVGISGLVSDGCEGGGPAPGDKLKTVLEAVDLVIQFWRNTGVL